MHGTSQGAPVSLSGYGGLVTLARPETVPEGASPRTYDTDFQVGSVKTRAGLFSIYNPSPATVGPSPATLAQSTSWLNPNNILHDDGSFTSFGPVSEFDQFITISRFGFSIPPTSSPTGVLLTVKGFANAPCNLIARLDFDSGFSVTKTLPLTTINNDIFFGSLLDNWGVALTPDLLNSESFTVFLMADSGGFDLATCFLDYATITVGLNTGTANFNFITTFTAQNGNVKNLLLDANGNFFVEDVTNNPGDLTLAIENITPNSYCVGVNGPDVEYLAFSDGLTGSDMPLQYTSKWIDRITQVGPGAAPAFTPAAASSNTFAISTITQFPPNSDITDPGHLSDVLLSAGPGSTAPGNVITVYYSPGFFGGAPHPEAQDMTLVNSFNSGIATYVFISGTTFADGTFLVTSVGNALPPGLDHQRYYFTVQVPTVGFQNIVEDTGQYQQTVATLTTGVPVPGLEVGNEITIAGTTVTAWDATWPISDTLNSASMVITNTSVTASVATYNYTVVTGTPPAAGEQVTVTGTTNADGALNVTGAIIVTASGGGSGTFTLDVPVVTAASAPESGQATTAGTVFQFDPGLTTVGTLTSPIFGDSTGGTLTFTGAAAQLIAPGTYQGTVFFITRNGYFTSPAPPVTFTCPENTTGIIASAIPIGPPNVVARGIAFTEAGANGVPGANFFAIPQPVTYIVNNVSYTATSTYINDNVTTSATFAFTSSVLLNSLAIDVYGYNLFNQIEIGDPAWITSYDGRNFYGLCRNKIQNFVNMSFDGGFLPVQQQGQLAPLGWSQPDSFGQLVDSPKFGNAYYILNNSGETLSVAGLISQTAYLDAYKTAIINPNTTYSVRVSVRNPSGINTGSLQIQLTSGGVVNGTFNLNLNVMATSYKIFTGTLLTTVFPTVPANLILTVAGIGLANNGDIEIDRIDIYPTDIPVLTTTVYGSYAGLPEQVDSVTGEVRFESENQQPVNGAVVMYDTFYGLKGWAGTAPGASLYSLQASSDLEPAQWTEPEVAQRSGAIGINAFDLGEQWIVMANRNGLYLFEGGQPGKINHEIIEIWNAINWNAAKTIWVKNDVVNRRLFIGVPLATPNFWLPNAPSVPTPTSPNVILMLNYQGLDSGEQLKSEPQMHTTMFGTLTAIDMRRKWSIWQIPSPYMGICQGHTATPGGFTSFSQDEQIVICNGRGNSKVYQLSTATTTDDGLIIDSLYTTAGLVPAAKRAETQGVGSFRLRWGYMVAALSSNGLINCTLYPNILLPPTPPPGFGNPNPQPVAGYNSWQVPGGFTPGLQPVNDAEAPLNFAATRTFFEFRENDGSAFTLSNLVMHVKKDVWNSLRGAK